MKNLTHFSLPFSRSVAGTVRSPTKAADLTASGCPAYALDLEGGVSPEIEAALRNATHLVATAPPLLLGGASPATSLTTPVDPILSSLDLTPLTPSLAWVAYVSSTSVYGEDRGGGWVGEEGGVGTSLSPKARARVAAEEQWKDWAGGRALPGAVFRAGGIYGPGRSALDIASGARPERRRGGEEGGAALEKPTSRIHVSDLARGLLTAAGRPPLPHLAWEVYDAVDGDPAPRAEVVEAARALLRGEEGGEQQRPEPTTGKRVRGERFAGLLQPEGGLLYPTYREGLRGILDGGACVEKER